MSSPDSPGWGLVYSGPGQVDVLLDRRYSREDAAVRIALQIAHQYIVQHEHDQPYLVVARSHQNVIRVVSRETGQTCLTLRPIVADRWLQSGRAPASEQITRFIDQLLDDDDWEPTER